MKHILFCGGGSAGHVLPNLAIMREIRYSCRLSYVGTGGIERDLVISAGYPFYEIDCPKLVRAFTLKNLLLPLRLPGAVRRAEHLLAQLAPDLVFSKGGFASYPAVRAAQKLGIPVFTHESDLSPGLCTRLIAKRCRLVLTAFPETAARFPNGRQVGSPMRKELFEGDRTRALHKYSFSEEKPILLVLGGGSGSRTLNQAVRGSLKKLLRRWQVLHLCGKGNLLAQPPAGYVQKEFETDMGSAYAAADAVLCRAGSNTLFEALALKKPVLAVPLEKSSRGDQLQNAEYFRSKGLCRVLREQELDRLPAALSELREDGTLRAALARSDLKNGTPAILDLLREG